MKTVCLVFAVLVVLYLLACLLFFLLASRRFRKESGFLSKLFGGADDPSDAYADIVKEGERWIREFPSEPVDISSFDGLRLHGAYMHNPDAQYLFIGCHGYRGSGVHDFSAACRYYYEHGCSVLLIDQRATGQSEGRYITFGMRERFDVQDWCRYGAERFPDMPILLGGISLGASTVLMASDELPPSVVALLVDCGYASAWDELAYVVHKVLRIPPEPIVRGIDLWCRLLGGFSLRQYSAPEALAVNTRPVFFVHGTADSFVPYENTPRNRAACAAPSMLFSVEGAEHGLSYLVDTEGQHAALDAFLKTYAEPAARELARARAAR